MSRGDQQHVNTPRDELFDGLPFELWILLGRSDHKRVAGISEGSGNAAYDLREEAVEQIGDDESDHVSAAGDERASGQIRTIVDLLNAFEHACFGLITDIGVIAEGFGDRDNADAEVSSDVF